MRAPIALFSGIAAALFLCAAAPDELDSLESQIDSGASSTALVDELHELVKRQPRNARAHYLLAVALSRAGYRTLAWKELRMAARRDLSFDRAIEQRFCLDMRDERFQRAGEEANVVRQFDPDLPDLLVLEGMQQRQAGHIVAARAAFSCAIKRNADLIGAHSGLASLQVIAGNYEQALPLVEYDLRRCPQHHEANLVKGEALLGLKRYAQALQPLRTAYQSAPMWPGTGILYATALEKTGDYQTALSAALKELSVQPDASEDRRVRQLVRSVSQNIEPGYVIKSIQSVQTGLQPGSWLDALRLRAEQRAANHGDDLAWQLKEFCRTLFR